MTLVQGIDWTGPGHRTWDLSRQNLGLAYDTSDKQSRRQGEQNCPVWVYPLQW